jgi:hypothetical protein
MRTPIFALICLVAAACAARAVELERATLATVIAQAAALPAAEGVPADLSRLSQRETEGLFERASGPRFEDLRGSTWKRIPLLDQAFEQPQSLSIGTSARSVATLYVTRSIGQRKAIAPAALVFAAERAAFENFEVDPAYFACRLAASDRLLCKVWTGPGDMAGYEVTYHAYQRENKQ